MLVYGECECFVMQMLYVCVLCASCGSSQCCVLHDLQFVNAGRGCNRRPYRRGILQSRSHNCFIGSHELSWRSGKRARLTCVQLRVRASLRANVLSLENLNVIIRAIN